MKDMKIKTNLFIKKRLVIFPFSLSFFKGKNKNLPYILPEWVGQADFVYWYDSNSFTSLLTGNPITL
jgi:hypothetical protein